jgi:hypothetical protein
VLVVSSPLLLLLSRQIGPAPEEEERFGFGVCSPPAMKGSMVGERIHPTTPERRGRRRDPLPTKKSIDPSPGGSAPPAEGEAFAWRLPEPGRGPSVRHEIEEEEGREARRVGERIITEQAMSGAVIPNVLRVKCAKWQTEAERAIRIDAVAVALVPCLWLYHLLTDRWAPTPMHSISHVLHFSFLEKYIINIFKKKYSTKYRYL